MAGSEGLVNYINIQKVSLALLLLVANSIFCSGDVLYADTGLLAEYYAPLSLEESCAKVNGSQDVLNNLVPTIVRRDTEINFPDRLAFNIDRCAWQKETVEGYKFGRLNYNCRGQEEILKNFAVRWTGYLYIHTAGYYTVELDSDDGARFVMGHGPCPGQSCATRWDVINKRFDALTRTYKKDGSYAEMCPECAQGMYINCWVTYYGCEPFKLWSLETDGGLGNCSRGPQKVNSTRYMNGGLHPIRIDYFQRGGPAHIVLRFAGPDTGGQLIVIPGNKLGYPKEYGLQRDWFDLQDTPPEHMKGLPPLTNYGRPPPGAKLVERKPDRFQNTAADVKGAFTQKLLSFAKPLYIRWTGFMQFDKPGEYKFSITSDDGGRMMIGGRGMGERVAVDNDGLHEGVRSASLKLELAPGLYPIRVEYILVPAPGAQAMAVSRPPGIEVTYEGPDTVLGAMSISRGNGAVTSNSDYTCKMTNTDWAMGMQQTRDCTGACFDNFEANVGDRVCDNGLLGTRVFTCPAYNNDNEDCDKEPNEYLLTTPRPEIECRVDCPPGQFHRKDCSVCAKKSPDGEHCLSSRENATTFLGCCTARLTNVNYWKSDCITYGTMTNCTADLTRILEDMNSRRLPWDVSASRDKRMPDYFYKTSGYVLSECNKDGCNEVTKEFIVNPFTGFDTKTRVCPTEEAEKFTGPGAEDLPNRKKGFQCYVGPWELTGLTDVAFGCQKFKWNFCTDRKTWDGRPFSKCCTFLYINAKGKGECRFTGLAQGTCEGYLNELSFNLSTSPYTAISDGQVLMDCAGDNCNNPMDEDFGCPQMVVEKPRLSEKLRPTDEPTMEVILKGSKMRVPPGPNWGLIGGLCSLPCLLICVALGASRYFVRVDQLIFHTEKAEIKADDTFVEPTRDDVRGPDFLRDTSFQKLGPRPFALTSQFADDKLVGKSLWQDPDKVAPEALDAAWADSMAVHAKHLGLDPNDPAIIDDFPEVDPNTTFTGAGRWKDALYSDDEEDDSDDDISLYSPSQAARPSTAGTDSIALPGQTDSRPVSSMAPSNRTSRRSSSKASTGSGSKSRSLRSFKSKRSTKSRKHSQASSNLRVVKPQPPTAMLTYTMGEVEDSPSGLQLPVAPTGRTAGRPAAAAKMMRDGLPRVAACT
eukprot:TRINITY_DN31411_c0_g1_i1.p1 TRINITY_DN31411_c0_g1~~TRINITY_DN31411_c0_g1_i1.p1  ORF type:complete len:1145 (+),score=169.04 TRINITY_DN31411_c0_g1_i1:103-3537(+)